MSTSKCSDYNGRPNVCRHYARTCEWIDDACITRSPKDVAKKLNGTLWPTPPEGMDCALVYNDKPEAGYVCWTKDEDDDDDGAEGSANVCENAINVFTGRRLNKSKRLVTLQYEDGSAVCYDAEDLLHFWEMPDAQAVEYVPREPHIIPDLEGYGSRPALFSPLYFKEPSSGVFIHAAVRRAILRGADVVRVARAPGRVRLGNIYGIFGVSMLHGQAPGEIIVVEAPLAGQRPTEVDDVFWPRPPVEQLPEDYSDDDGEDYSDDDGDSDDDGEEYSDDDGELSPDSDDDGELMSAGQYTLYYDSDPKRRNDLCKEAYELHRNHMRQEHHLDSVYAIDLAENAEALSKYGNKLMPLIVHNAGSEMWESQAALECLCKLFGVRRALTAGSTLPQPTGSTPPGAVGELTPLLPPALLTPPPPLGGTLGGSSNTGLRPLPKPGDNTVSIFSLPPASNAVDLSPSAMRLPPPPLPPAVDGIINAPPGTAAPSACYEAASVPPQPAAAAAVPQVPPEFVLYCEDSRATHHVVPANGLVKLVNLKLMRSIVDTSLMHNYLRNPHALPMLVTMDEAHPTIWYGAAAIWQCRLLAAINGGPDARPPTPAPDGPPDFVLYVDDFTMPIIVPHSGQVRVRRLTPKAAEKRAYLRDAPNMPVLVTHELRPTVWHGKAARFYCHMLSALCGGGIYISTLASANSSA